MTMIRFMRLILVVSVLLPLTGYVHEASAQMCDIEVELVTECDDNGTPCDPNDDFYRIFMTVEFPMSRGGQYLARFGTLTAGPLPYGPNQVLLGTWPADPFGGTECLIIVDEASPQCREEVCSDMLVPCPTIFQISVFQSKCNDNRTANDPTDDFYEIRMAGGLGLASWPGLLEIDVNGSVVGLFPHNEIIEFNIPADGNPTIVTARDNVDGSCVARRNMGPLTPCSTPCAQQPQIVSYVCQDNGTPDPNDDFYQVVFTSNAAVPGMTGRYRVNTPFVPPLPFPYGVPSTVLIPARGQFQLFEFNDVDYDDCGAEIEIGPLDPCSEMCEVELDSINFECDDNGTPDPADDFYRVTIIVNGVATGSGYNVQIGGTDYGPFDYDSIEVFQLPADGSEPRLNFRDINFPMRCFTFEIAPPLEPCSFPCDLVIESIFSECDDKGTSDPSDDEYTVTVHVDNLLGTSADSFYLLIDGNQLGPYAYDRDQTFNWAADGQSYSLVIQDQKLGDRCELEVEIGPFIPCSSDCELTIDITNITCDDEGTGQDESDDTFTFSLTVDGNNVGPQWKLNDAGNTQAAYGQTVVLGPFLIANGSVVYEISDILDSFCRQSIEIIPPAPCSNECALEVQSVDIGPCNDNDTGPNSNDDFFFVELIVDAINGSASNQYEVVLGGNTFGPYTYGVNELVGPLPANGNNLNLSVRDLDDAACEEMVSVRQDPCSSCDGFTVDAGADQLITCSANQVTLMGSASAQGTYTWTGPNGNTLNGPNPVVGEPGIYILTVEFDKECTETDTVVVRRDQNLPFADAGPPLEITCEVDSVTIGGDSTSMGMNLVYEWTNEQGQVVGRSPFLTVGVPGRYCLQVIDTLLDCESAANCVNVRENKVAPTGQILVNPMDAFDCRVDSISLIADGGDSSTFYWEKNAVVFLTDTLWVTDTGRVILFLKDTINGCTTELDIHINSLIDYPVISITPPDEITCLSDSVVIDARNSQSGPNIIYQWMDGNGNAIPGARGRTLQVSNPGPYIFEATDTLTGCINRDTVSVDEDRIFHVANGGMDALIMCDSPSVFLDASMSTRMNNISYLWRRLVGSGQIVSGQGTLFPEIDGQGVFELQVKDDLTGCVSYDTVVVDRAFAPALDRIIAKGETCGGAQDGFIDATGIRGLAPFTYELNGRPVDTTRFDSLKPGLFFFRVTDSLGCFTDTLLEIKEGNYFDFKIEGDTFIIRGDSTYLSVDINIPVNEVDQVYWEEDGSVFCFRCYGVWVKPDTTTTYDFRLIDVNGCTYSFSFVIKVQEKNTLYVPNVFTPNGDTDNEVLHIFGKNLVNLNDVKIFNRWGELVFHGQNLPPGPVWDGYWNGNLHVPAVLTWMIDAQFKDGTIKRFTGDVTLLR